MTISGICNVHNLFLLYLIYSFILSDWSLKACELKSPVLNEDLYEANVSLIDLRDNIMGSVLFWETGN